MSMTKKDYELVAMVIKGQLENNNLLESMGWTPKDRRLSEAVVEDLAHFMAYHLKKQNPKFDRIRFLKACGVLAD